jgi:hypothetical protein
VLGHRIGLGNGLKLGTIAGALGGGFAGNAIEGRMRKETVYQVGVRMEDGSRRTMEVAQAPAVGSRVTGCRLDHPYKRRCDLPRTGTGCSQCRAARPDYSGRTKLNGF